VTMPFYRSDFAVVGRDLFSVMRFIGLLFFPPVLVSLITGEISFAPGFAIMGILVFLFCHFARKAFGRPKVTEFRHAMVTVVLVWVVTCALGAVPFFVYLGLPPLDALFESVSAWTTTGFTVITHASQSPMTLLFWRSFMQWIGGIGLVVAILTGVLSMGGSLYLAEARDERIKPNVINTVKTLWWIYILYTFIGVGLFMLAGMPFFDAMNHSMTAIATGGMSDRDASIGYYSSFAVELVAMFLMLAGSISFFSHYQLLRGSPAVFFRDVQIRMMACTAVVASALVVPWVSLREGIFHVVSAMTCTGFAISDLSTWHEFPLVILIVLMVMGGSSGSTAGALKMFRVGVLLRSLRWNLRKLLRPHVVLPRKFGDWKFGDEEVRAVLLFALLYVVLLGCGTLVLMAHGYGGTASLFETASAQGNVGLSMGIVNKDAPSIVKIALMGNMLAGRLEIWAVLVTIGVLFMRR